MSPTELTLRELRRRGWTAEVVERWIPGANIRRDLFGGIDIVGMKIRCGILGVQCTTRPHATERLVKLSAEPRMVTWLRSGGRLDVWGWAKRCPRGGRKLWGFSRWRATWGPGGIDWNLIDDAP